MMEPEGRASEDRRYYVDPYWMDVPDAEPEPEPHRG